MKIPLQKPKKRKWTKLLQKLELASRKKLSKSMLFHYVKNPKLTGALFQSSSRLSAAITKNINIESAQNIIEIGPGMGAFTSEILKRKPKDARFLAVEINPKIAKALKTKMKNIDIAVDSARFLPKIMESRGMPSADIVISGIPWAFLKNREQDEVLEGVILALKKGGYFATFAYIIPTISARRFRKKLKNLFSEVYIGEIIWRNLPPAFVYYCKK